MKAPSMRAWIAASCRRPPRLGLRTAERLRLLPLLIFVGSLFLSVKVGLIWRDAGSWFTADAIAVANAHARSAGGVETEPEAEPEAHPARPAEAPHGGDNAGGEEAQADQTAAPKERPVAENPEAPAFSPAEVEVLRQLAKRRAVLDARARELDKRDALLRAAESRLDAKAEALKGLQDKVGRLIKQHDAEQDAKMASLAKLYESMKPKDAAAILQTLDLDTLLLVAERMKERKLAAIMAEMNPARARDVTMELVRQPTVDAEPHAEAGRASARAAGAR
jgi:flagellar motility protein MotE (MotC chaperone)